MARRRRGALWTRPLPFQSWRCTFFQGCNSRGVGPNCTTAPQHLGGVVVPEPWVSKPLATGQPSSFGVVRRIEIQHGCRSLEPSAVEWCRVNRRPQTSLSLKRTLVQKRASVIASLPAWHAAPLNAKPCEAAASSYSSVTARRLTCETAPSDTRQTFSRDPAATITGAHRPAGVFMP
jgi:hypothetical protein